MNLQTPNAHTLLELMPSSDVVYYVFLPKLVEILGPIKLGYINNNDETWAC